MTIETHIIGDGCSAMMLASRADELEKHKPHLGQATQCAFSKGSHARFLEYSWPKIR